MVSNEKKRFSLIILIAVILFAGCMSPTLQKGESLESFSRRYCLHVNKKNPGLCAVEGEEYRKSAQEGRVKKRLEYCEEKKFIGMTKNECRLYLNQK